MVKLERHRLLPWRVGAFAWSVSVSNVGGDENTDNTDITDSLNWQISSGDSDGTDCGIFCGGGGGVLIRNPFDGYEDGGPFGWVVIPATFWHNDIAAASQMYPSTLGAMDNWGGDNVDCPNTGFNGYFEMDDCVEDTGTGERSPWTYASTGYVIGDSMGNVFRDYDNIQDPDWGWGVMYPTDSNSVDFRCRYLADWDGYDCGPDLNGRWPGGWIQNGQDWVQDDSKFGPGMFGMGNPFALPDGGGGTGCHFDKGGNMVLDQTDAYGDGGENLVRNSDCECNYDFFTDSTDPNTGWEHWVEWWIGYATEKPGISDAGWFAEGKAPSRGLDMVSCWMNNPRDMINLQNWVWWKRWEWSNQLAPKSDWVWEDPNTHVQYWGWNEIPVDRYTLTDPLNHQAFFIKLPGSICGEGGGSDTIWCLGAGQQYALERDIDNWVQNGYVVPGIDNIAYRPGSYAVVVREWWIRDKDWWQRYFFCEDWVSPNGQYQLAYWPPVDGFPGACFIDYGNVDWSHLKTQPSRQGIWQEVNQTKQELHV